MVTRTKMNTKLEFIKMKYLTRKIKVEYKDVDLIQIRKKSYFCKLGKRFIVSSTVFVIVIFQRIACYAFHLAYQLCRRKK